MIESSTIYWPTTLPTPLIGRQLSTNPRSWASTFESRRTRTRRAHDASLRMMAVNWNFTAEEYAEFVIFFQVTIEQGTRPFAMTTLEQDDDPTLVREYVRELAFGEGGYSFSQDDNLVSVSAELEVDAEEFEWINNPFNSNVVPPLPDIDYDFASACRETIVMTWLLPEDYESGTDVLQASVSLAGPWYDYIDVVATALQKATREMTLWLNNTYNGERWFRLTRNGVSIKSPVRPAASVVAPPSGIEITATTESEFTMRESGPFIRPVSYIENALLNPSDTYIEPHSRREYLVAYPNPATLSIVSATGLGDGDELRWTTNGSDPTAEMSWPPPIRDGAEFNAQAYKPNFGLVIKARCFNGECKSPIVLVLVDKRLDALRFVKTVGRQGEAEKWCVTNPDNGLSCQLLYGGSGNLGAAASASACSALTDSTQSWRSGGASGYPIIWQKAVSSANIVVWAGTMQPAESSYSLKRLSETVEPNGSGYSDHWTYVPVAFEKVSVLVGEELFVANVANAESANHVCGVGGTLTAHCQAATPFIVEFVPSCLPETNQTLLMDRFDVLVSLYNDETPVLPEEPPTDPEPLEPVDVNTGYRETFESYLDGSVVGLNGDEGWNNAWVFNQSVILEGEELFESYTDGAVAFQELNQGAGWVASGSWVFVDSEETDYYGLENWEDYTDGVITFAESLALAEGVNWALKFPSEPDLGMGYWVFSHMVIGGENWQSYADQTIPVPSLLEGNEDLSWTNDGWVFNN